MQPVFYRLGPEEEADAKSHSVFDCSFLMNSLLGIGEFDVSTSELG